MPNVVSKYFSTETGMDDSLSDFQKKKKYNTGPKNVRNTRNIKKPKCSRGQKDIRALIKKQESDVLSYSKDFDKVCKEAGFDVNSEELQLAIALSKSLQEVKKENSSDAENKSTEHLTSQQRILKIKTTLQEYGFKVPKTKITETNRRKKIRKQYKLLLTTEVERRQIISDKYSEVLAGNIFKTPAKILECDYSDKELYYKTTNIAYEHIKNDDVYYVKGLFDKTGHKSCLLRDWSEIPGRPLSPTIEGNNINFDNIICKQHELDCILSGTVFAAQQIVTSKNNTMCKSIKSKNETTQLELVELEPIENHVGHIDDNAIEFNKENNTLHTPLNTMSISQVRCISPDLFDDEVSMVMECTDTDVLLSGQTLSKSDNIHTYCMDLTECVNTESYNSDFNAKTNLQTNNKTNITNRKSNDLMEITECISTGSKQINFENIDLTQSSNDSNKQISPYENIEIMDLTQDPGYDHLVVEKCLTKKDNSHDDTIILVDDNLNSKLQIQKQNLTSKELLEPICIDDLNNCEDNFNAENRKDLSHQSSTHGFKDYLYNKSNENSFERCDLKNIEELGEHTELLENQPGEFDLTQSSNSSQGESFTDQPNSVYSSNFARRDNISIDYDEIIDNIESASQSNSIEKEANKSKDITLNPNKGLGEFEFLSEASNYCYQSEHEKEFRCITIINDENDHQENEVLNLSNELAATSSKKSEVIEISDKESSNNCYQSKHENEFRCFTVINDENDPPENEALNSSNELAATSSKNSEVFEISDKELNYSLHQSKKENFDFRDVSVMNDFTNYVNHSMGESNQSSRQKRSLSESNLFTRNIVSPLKEVPHSQNTEAYNPIQSPNEKVNNVCTPKNSEYVIKTNDITPMLDYASMSSPERHQELEKYGLKPFKRKRAIQLLTYLYNQTHPVIESHDELSSPSKRQKKNDADEECNSPNTSKSVPLVSISKTCTATTIKSIKPIEFTPDLSKENDLYAMTNEQPDIRNIECDPEDWFFQKREKAKLHSCRVPLHIAFHNYVSCRRRLREAILRYEPVNIDFIQKELVATGYRYNPKDLLKFMDRKCITVKTADNNSRNRKS